jgi:hypothetical protein
MKHLRIPSRKLRSEKGETEYVQPKDSLASVNLVGILESRLENFRFFYISSTYMTGPDVSKYESGEKRFTGGSLNPHPYTLPTTYILELALQMPHRKVRGAASDRKSLVVSRRFRPKQGARIIIPPRWECSHPWTPHFTPPGSHFLTLLHGWALICGNLNSV